MNDLIPLTSKVIDSALGILLCQNKNIRENAKQMFYEKAPNLETKGINLLAAERNKSKPP